MINKILKAGRETYPLNSLNAIVLRIRFFKHVLCHLKLIKSFIDGIEHLGYSALFEHKIPVLGVVEWPYIHKEWHVAQRFDRISEHYKIIKTLPQFLDVANGHPNVIINTNQFSSGSAIVLDKAQWFVREGEIVLNLFKDDCRMMSIAFTFSHLNGELVMYVGAIQGIHADDHSLEKIKKLTKDFEGLRPRDLLIEVLRMLVKKVGAKKILGIADDYRHHHHPYFACYHSQTLKTSYNSIWLEQQAEPFGHDFYAIPLTKDRRALEDTSSNKRAMYRRRYEILDSMNNSIDTLFEKTPKMFYESDLSNEPLPDVHAYG